MPYRWQVKEDDGWKAMPANEAIEKDYCDPQNPYRYFVLICYKDGILYLYDRWSWTVEYPFKTETQAFLPYKLHKYTGVTK